MIETQLPDEVAIRQTRSAFNDAIGRKDLVAIEAVPRDDCWLPSERDWSLIRESYELLDG
jgi:hypothetical protein